MVPRPILYGKGKGPHGVTFMAQPLQPPTILTPRVENGKRSIVEALESTSPHIITSSPTSLPPVPIQDSIPSPNTVVMENLMTKQESPTLPQVPVSSS